MEVVDLQASTNVLVSLWPNDEKRIIAPYAQRIELHKLHRLFDQHASIKYIYFLEGGLSSEIAVAPDGTKIEIASVGREGLSGFPVLLSSATSPHYSFMQIGGAALRIRSSDILELLPQCPTARRLADKYVAAYSFQLASTALANARYTIQQRLARWLLMCQDRIGGSVIPLTHEFLALMLGVRRPGITTALHVLEGEHAIRAQRGRLIVRDRKKLESLAGGCYGLAEAEYVRLIGASLARSHSPGLANHLTGSILT